MPYLRYYLSVALMLSVFKPATAQTWAVKSLPFVYPGKVLKAFVLPTVVEYEQARLGFQIAPVFGVINERLNREVVSSSGEKYRPIEYARHFHLNIGTRRYLGRKPVSRAWMIGINTWVSVHRNWTKDPVLYSLGPIVEDFGTRISYRGTGIFIGKNFKLGRYFFIESKIAVEYFRFYSTDDVWINRVPSPREESEMFWFPRPSLLIGYRW